MEIEIKPATLYKHKLVIVATYLDSSYEEVHHHLHEALTDYLSNPLNYLSKAVYDDLNRMRIMLDRETDKNSTKTLQQPD